MLKKRRCSVFTAAMAFLAAFAGPGIPAASAGDFETRLGVRGVWAAEIDGIVPGSTAEVLGLHQDDLVTGLNGQSMRDFADFSEFVASMRDAAIRDKAVLDVLKHDPISGSYTPDMAVAMVQGGDPSRQMIGMRCGLTFLVQEVVSGGPAAQMGLEPGDFVLDVNGVKLGNISGPAAVDAIVRTSASTADREITLYVTRWRRVDSTTRKMTYSLQAKGNL